MPLKVYPSPSPVAGLVLAHGAGAGASSTFMVRTAVGLAERGVSTATFDFPYITAGRKVPDRADVLERSWRDAVELARETFSGLPLFIGGKSMGGRVASHVAAARCDGLRGLVFLGYPLHLPGRPDQRRDAHLPAIREPMLFVQGTRDAFGTAEEIRALLPSLHRAAIHAVEGGDHSFKVAGRSAPGPEAVLGGVMNAVADWVRSNLVPGDGPEQA